MGMVVALFIICFILGFSIVDHPAMAAMAVHPGYHGLPLAVFQEVFQFFGLLGLGLLGLLARVSQPDASNVHIEFLYGNNPW